LIGRLSAEWWLPLIYVLCVYGSPRKGGNTEILVKYVADKFKSRGANVDLVRLCDLEIKPCISCRKCVNNRGTCFIDDDMTKTVIPKLLLADGLVVASPVYFNNVSACVKIFIDRTWCLRGKLRDIVGGSIVVGRGYGAELALAAIHAFMLKHEMVLGIRGVTGFAYEKGEIKNDIEAFKWADKLVNRMYDLICKIKRTSSNES